MARRKVKKQFLKRPERFMVRFSREELKACRTRAQQSGLSQVEYCRRKILDIPIAEITPREPVAEAVA